MTYSYNLTGDNREVIEKGITQSPEVTIGSLTAFTRYKFAVAAATSAGQGPWSEPLRATTKEAGTIKCTSNSYISHLIDTDIPLIMLIFNLLRT